MNTIVKSLKALTTKLGGTDTTSKTVVDALKKVFSAYGGTGSTAKTISGAIDEIATVAVATPSGKLPITGTSEVNCASYATAQVSSDTLIAENIKKDVSILGVTGSYEGGGSSDFSTATVTITLTGHDQYVVIMQTDSGDAITGLIKVDGDWYTESQFSAEFSLTTTMDVLISDPLIVGGFLSEPTVEGNATKEYQEEYQVWLVSVTGTCSITGQGQTQS